MAERTELVSQWHRHIEGAQHSVDAFYGDVEAAIERRSIPGVAIRRIELKEGGLLSAKRLYLRISRDDLYFDICGAPFANGFFVSSRLITIKTFKDAVVEGDGSGFGNFLSAVGAKALGTDTWYRVDTAMMFQQLIHNALMEVVDALTEQQVLPRVTGSDRKPLMRSFF